MDKKKVLKIVGTVGVVGGTVCLFVSGVPVASVSGIVGGVFALAALVAVIFA